MLLDVGITSGFSLNEAVNICVLAQKLNVYGVWIGEDIAALHDIFTTTSVALLRTSRLKIGIGITSPVIRNISTVARAAVCLKEINGDRFRLGLGIGGLHDLSRLNIHFKNSVGIMRNVTHLLRRIWMGEAITFTDETFSLKHYYTRYGLGYKIPVYFGVRGPKLLELAGEVADGVILSGPKTYLKKAVSIVKKGIEKVGRPPGNFKFVVWIPTIVTHKKRELNLVKQTVALVLSDSPNSVLKMTDLNIEKLREIQEAHYYHGLEKAASLVTGDVLEEFTIHGSPKEVCEAFKSFEPWGINETVFGPPYGSDTHSAIVKVAQSWRNQT